MKLKLHQFLARAGAAKKNYEITQMIKAGRVRVDGRVVTAASFMFDAKKKRVYLDGQIVRRKPARYFLVNKPRGYSCQRGESPNVSMLLRPLLEGDASLLRSLFAVGRLDRDTEGIVIVTNDGRTASRITSPIEAVEKEYEAEVEGELPDAATKALREGVKIEVGDKCYRTQPAKVVLVKKISSSSTVRITLTEGKKRQVRKMFVAIGHPVIALRRIRIGALRIEAMRGKRVVEMTKEAILAAISDYQPSPRKRE
jgi:pseudouridine synthase